MSDQLGSGRRCTSRKPAASAPANASEPVSPPGASPTTHTHVPLRRRARRVAGRLALGVPLRALHGVH